jgi:hypothetical protein
MTPEATPDRRQRERLGRWVRVATILPAMSDEPLGAELAGAAAGMVPVIGPLLEVFARRTAVAVTQEGHRARSVALKAAERSAGCTREELGEAIAKDPRLVPLLVRLLYAAGMTGQDRTLKIMGTALGDAVREPSRVDEVEMILAAVAGLGEKHFRILEVLAGHPPPPAATGERQEPWGRDNLAQMPSMLEQEATLNIGLAGLIGAGLVFEQTGLYGGGTALIVTALGETVLQLLDEMGDRAT